MAWTITRRNSVHGDQRVVHLDVTPDSATYCIETGLSKIEAVNLGLSSMGTANVKVAVNSNCSGVQSMGVLGCTGFASGDRFFATVYGQ